MEEALTFILDILGWPLEFLGQFPLIRNILAVILGVGFIWAFGALFYVTIAPREKADSFWEWLQSGKSKKQSL